MDFITPKQLDAIAKSDNPLSKETLRAEFKNLIRKLARLTDQFVKDDTVSDYSDMLVKHRYLYTEVQEAFDKAVALGKFPPYGTLVGFIDRKDEAKQSGVKDTLDKIRLEDKACKKLRDLYTSRYGNTLDRFIKFWATLYYGEQFINNLKDTDIKLSMFEKCALFDWQRYGYNFDTMKERLSTPNEHYQGESIGQTQRQVEEPSDQTYQTQVPRKPAVKASEIHSDGDQE